ncbi:helix-turn-helix domain-containing protein [Corallincola luteus]|uniref:Helix-turn-helix domain-containing protein n=4 Tax=Psychromonadaceae TaxID=267894 RepID=A0A368NL45_9GAMM|nr:MULTISPECIES: helix-turn-helix domain-containing protein [Corallincola]RCU51158.1 helix-turn-helix domain-containing protein [Corallincola holothuriorum]TAA46089.1 helix-turn-helix domain-containing protein [Corallincola spongiicola]TCI04136.1 helix-turn-helix domain-containing protein [Corallincola luteus]
MMSVADVAAFLKVSEVRVERLAREKLLVPKEADGENPLFDEEDVKRYKILADRLGGL